MIKVQSLSKFVQNKQINTHNRIHNHRYIYDLSRVIDKRVLTPDRGGRIADCLLEFYFDEYMHIFSNVIEQLLNYIRLLI